jgi:hypothetical protein
MGIWAGTGVPPLENPIISCPVASVLFKQLAVNCQLSTVNNHSGATGIGIKPALHPSPNPSSKSKPPPSQHPTKSSKQNQDSN